MSNYRYISSCIFTRDYPETSMKIQGYLRDRWNMDIIRCCVDKYKVKIFEEQMPGCVSKQWKDTPHYKPFASDDVMVSICHNCTAIFQEQHTDTKVISLWELLLQDESFAYPNYHGEAMTVQDCWRQYDNRAEQDAVREILHRMNVKTVEIDENYEKTKYCGVSNLQPSIVRNLKLAPRRFVDNADGMFQPHSEHELIKLMKAHVSQYITDKVVVYCHYCARGLELAGQDHFHLAQMLFTHP